MRVLVMTGIFTALAVTMALSWSVGRWPQGLMRWRVRVTQALAIPVGVYVVAANNIRGPHWLAAMAPLVVFPATAAQLVVYATGLPQARRARTHG